MWIKFDGKSAVVRIPETKEEIRFPFTIDQWVHIAIIGGKLYIDGINKKEEK